MPTTSRVLTSNFGARWGRQHKGLDIKVYIGDTIRAAFDGKVRVVRYEGRGYGKYVVIRHDNGLETYYAHLSKQLVTEDQDVRAGEPIGLGGNTGRSTGSHLHFETRICGVALNPALMFDFRNQDVVDDYYMFRKSTYQKESVVATRLRGAGGISFSDNSEDVELATAAPAASYTQEARFHKVKKGETLYSIAKKRGTTVDTIMKLNHLKKNAEARPDSEIQLSKGKQLILHTKADNLVCPLFLWAERQAFLLFLFSQKSLSSTGSDSFYSKILKNIQKIW